MSWWHDDPYSSGDPTTNREILSKGSPPDVPCSHSVPLGKWVWIETETWAIIPRAAGDDISNGSGPRFAVLDTERVVRILTDELGVFAAYVLP